VNNRITNCIKLLKADNYDSFLISDPTNISYLTGFWNGDGYLLITTEGKLVYFTNFLYMQVAKKIKLWKLVISEHGQNIFNLIADEARKYKCKNTAFEAKNLPFLEYKTLNERFSENDIRFSGINDFIEKIRMIKDKDELCLIKKSIQVSKETFAFASEILDEKMSEKDLSIEIDKFLRLKADNQLAFETIVACGKNTAYPHHKPTEKKINRNFFLIDLGSKYYGYCADLTRVFFWGKMPLFLKKIYDTLRKAQDSSIKGIKEGITAAQLDSVARKIIEQGGWGKYFGHGLGHGIGLSVHELPALCPNNNQILKEGMVVTIEPAVYFDNRFGMRLEDMVLIKQNYGEVLSGDIDR